MWMDRRLYETWWVKYYRLSIPKYKILIDTVIYIKFELTAIGFLHATIEKHITVGPNNE